MKSHTLFNLDDLYDESERCIIYLENNPENGKAWNDLWSLFSKGAPVESLCRLLYSNDIRVVSGAAWLASELGENALVLSCDMYHFLKFPEVGIRYWALEYFTAISKHTNKQICKAVLHLLEDECDLIRVHSMRFLSLSYLSTLEQTLNELKTNCTVSPHIVPLELYLAHINNPDDLFVLLNDERPLVKKYIAAAASFYFHKRHDLLLKCLFSCDKDVKIFTKSEYKKMSFYRRQRNK